MKTSEILKNLRLEKGLTQKELGKKLNIGQSTVNGYEKGLNAPVADILIAYSKFFNVSTDYLLGLEDEIDSKPEKTVIKKISSEDFTQEEIEIIKGIRELNFTDQNALKVVLNSFLSKNSTTKEKIKQ